MCTGTFKLHVLHSAWKDLPTLREKFEFCHYLIILMFCTFVRNTKYIFKNVGSKHNLTPLTFIVYKKKTTTYFVLMHIQHHDNGKCSISFKHSRGLRPKITWTPSFAALQALAFPSGNANRENSILMICLYLLCGALLLGFRIMLIQNVTLVYCTFCAHSVRPDIWMQIYIMVISHTIFLTELLGNSRKKLKNDK